MSYPTRQLRDLPVEKQADDILDSDLLVGQLSAGGVRSFFKSKASSLATYVSKYHNNRRKVVRLEDWSGLDLTGSNDCASIVRAAHVQANSAGWPIGLPVGRIAIGSAVELKANMAGVPGNGYNGQARTVFVSSVAGGGAALYSPDVEGLDLRYFAIESTTPAANPNPSGGTALLGAGLRLGTPPAIVTNITKAAQPTVTTKFIHAFRVGQTVMFENVRGMVELEGLTGTVVSVPTPYTFTVNRDTSAMTTFSSRAIVHLSDGSSSASGNRGVLEDITVSGFAVNFQIAGWLARMMGLKSLYGTLGFDGGYLNSTLLDLWCEQTYQGAQFMGCTGTTILRMQEEGSSGGSGGDLGSASTIDFCNSMDFRSWVGEGTRYGATPWVHVGYNSYSEEIHIARGSLSDPGGGGVSAALDNVDRWTLPKCIAGYSTTGNTRQSFYPFGGVNGPKWTHGNGSPEGVITGKVGDFYSRLDGGGSTTLYVKTSGTGNTGWTAK